MSKTRNGIANRYKIAGGGVGKVAEWIPKNKVKSFRLLFDKVRDHCGTIENTKEFLGLSAHTLDDLYKWKISAATGRKILEGYNKIKVPK